MPILWTTLIKRERKQMRGRGRGFKSLPKYIVSAQIFYLARDHLLSLTSLKESQRQGKEANFPNDYKFWKAKKEKKREKGKWFSATSFKELFLQILCTASINPPQICDKVLQKMKMDWSLLTCRAAAPRLLPSTLGWQMPVLLNYQA